MAKENIVKRIEKEIHLNEQKVRHLEDSIALVTKDISQMTAHERKSYFGISTKISRLHRETNSYNKAIRCLTE